MKGIMQQEGNKQGNWRLWEVEFRGGGVKKKFFGG